MYADGPRPLTYAPPSYENVYPIPRRDDSLDVTQMSGPSGISVW
jgi:hypothetical protein